MGPVGHAMTGSDYSPGWDSIAFSEEESRWSYLTMCTQSLLLTLPASEPCPRTASQVFTKHIELPSIGQSTLQVKVLGLVVIPLCYFWPLQSIIRRNLFLLHTMYKSLTYSFAYVNMEFALVNVTLCHSIQGQYSVSQKSNNLALWYFSFSCPWILVRSFTGIGICQLQRLERL